MPYHQPSIPCHALISLAMALCAPPVHATQGVEHNGFPAQVRHIVTQVARNGATALRRFTSHTGILVVRREVDWIRSGEPLRETKMVGPDDLDLSRLDPLVWIEVETRFDGHDQSGQRFEEIGARFQRFVQESRRDFHGEEYSLDLRDHWNSRRLGPVAAGKLASNEFWYIYFMQEKGQWRVWKLELAYH